tara:strand:- start:7053 stop:8153 length:1101 start_codon:yes stop_codon:yes gene_type:complete
MDHLDKLLTGLQTALIVFSKDLKVEYMNASAEDIFSVSKTSCLGKNISDLFYEEPDNLNGLKQVFKKKIQLTKHDAVLYLREGKTVVCDYQACYINLGKNSEKLIFEINKKEFASKIKQNVTLINNQKVTSQFARGMAHEIKNPLSGIKGAAQLLEKQLDRDELKEYTNIVIQQTERLSRLVDNILGPNTKPIFELQNIHFPIEKMLALIEVETLKEIKIIKDFDPSIPEISFDLSLIEQALLNILKNARDALFKEASESYIKVTTRVGHQEYIGKKRFGTICKIIIEDNGQGIPQEMHDSIFFPMISGKEGGNGLGLAITQGILSQHNGTVTFNSSQHKTTFTLMLPIEKNDIDENNQKELIYAK